MRLWLPVLFGLAACTGNGPATEESAPARPEIEQAVPKTSATGYGTTAHVRAYPATVVEGDAGDPTLAVRITLSPRTARPVHVDFLTADSSAKEGEDYRRAKGRVTFKPGITEQTIAIRIIGDDVAEGEESFLLRLHVAEYAQLDTESVTITITDDD
ncbi:MAG: Calx-beta domain-containing protein [Woeseiaceae bacterium]